MLKIVKYATNILLYALSAKGLIAATYLMAFGATNTRPEPMIVGILLIMASVATFIITFENREPKAPKGWDKV